LIALVKPLGGILSAERLVRHDHLKGLAWGGHDRDTRTHGERHAARQHEEPYNQEGHGAHRLTSFRR
jgi:hypothetical protein